MITTLMSSAYHPFEYHAGSLPRLHFSQIARTTYLRCFETEYKSDTLILIAMERDDTRFGGGRCMPVTCSCWSVKIFASGHGEAPEASQRSEMSTLTILLKYSLPFQMNIMPRWRRRRRYRNVWSTYARLSASEVTLNLSAFIDLEAHSLPCTAGSFGGCLRWSVKVRHRSTMEFDNEGKYQIF